MTHFHPGQAPSDHAKAGPCPPDLRSKFKDFDNPHVYELVKACACSAQARNFVVEFGPLHSRIAWDLDKQDFVTLLGEKQAPTESETVRWINFWGSRHQEDVVDHIGKHYGFSRRLRESMRVWDQKKPQILEAIRQHRHRKAQRETTWKPKRHRGSKHHDPPAAGAADAEKGLGSNTTSLSSSEQSPTRLPVLDLNSQEDQEDQDLQDLTLIHGSLNYNTIDQVLGKFICIGANWLYRSARMDDNPDPHEHSLVPPKHWTWCALCFDQEWTASSADPTPNSVFTFHETPLFDEFGTPGRALSPEEQAREIRNIRKNTLRVLLQLSQCGVDEYGPTVTQLASIRKTDATTSSTYANARDLQVEMSSNLFYYLYEDYGPASAILNEARDILGMLDRRILTYPQRKDFSRVDEVIPQLHQVSKDLRQLQHLFISYKKLVDRMLSSATLATPSTAEGELAQARLAASARDRFCRLSDRLELLMLNTIQEYLEENKSLVTTYFNLTAQKDSQATARLTRSATLLAKLSVFFLPVNFITSYFSMQVPGLTNVNPKTYWIIFGVTLSSSFLSLFFFSRMLMIISDSLDEWQRKAVGWTSRRIGWPKNKESVGTSYSWT